MTRRKKRIAVLWDESALWGLLAIHSFESLKLDFDLITAEAIIAGGLDGYSVLFTPGGWAADKSARLDEDGAEAIRSFISEGGSYLGVCGGAGLALSVDGGLGLLPVGRRQGLSNFSGPIGMEPGNHAVFDGLPRPVPASVWWPGHFNILDDGAVDVLARYGRPLPGFMVADIMAEDAEKTGGWDKLESVYDMALDPSSLSGAPLVIEGALGKGRVVLSYSHLETPGDAEANRALENLFAYLSKNAPKGPETSLKAGRDPAKANSPAHELMGLAADFREFGQKRLLWTERNQWLLRWRRGIRGIEYNTLLNMIAQIGRMDARVDENTVDKCRDFFSEARELLRAEAMAINSGPLHPFRCENGPIKKMRSRLFGLERRPAGVYKGTLDALDHSLSTALQDAIDAG